MCVRSMSAVLWPALAKAPARGVPAWPEPIIIASYFAEVAMVLEVNRKLKGKLEL